MTAPSIPTSATPRREFLGQLATVAAAFAVTACASGGMGAAAASAAPAEGGPKLAPVLPLPPLHFDDSWTTRLTGRYKAVFDSPEIDDGTAVFNAYVYIQGFKDMYTLQDSDVSTVIVMRHMAIPMALDDEFWAAYGLGEYAKIKEPGTEQWALRNPFWKASPKDPEDAAYTLDALQRRGTVLLGCSFAAHGMASILAKRSKQKPNAVFDELRQHLIPGLELAPSGIFAVMRAQEAGCKYMRST